MQKGPLARPPLQSRKHFWHEPQTIPLAFFTSGTSFGQTGSMGRPIFVPRSFFVRNTRSTSNLLTRNELCARESAPDA